MKTLTFTLVLLLIINEVKGLNNLHLNQKPRNYLDLSTNGVDFFDVSDKWPQCKDVFEDIQTQGNCSSSWAISVGTSIRDRRCIKSGVKDPISAYDLISCCTDCQLDGKNGCNGGDHDSAFQYFINQGIVTGGKYNSHKGCKPYPIRPDPKADAPKDTQCIKTCKSSYNKDYDNDKIKGTDQIPFAYNNKGVMDEIMTNGPVISEFRLYEDFYNYSGGIYQYKEGKLLGYYYAKILAWGEDEGVKFWSAAASFGSNWGENGMFRIKRQNDECGFESNIIAGIVEDTPDVKPTTTIAPKPANLNCQKITAYYDGTFQSIYNPSTSIYVQMQVVADINLNDNRTYFKFDKWNRTLADEYTFGIWNGKDDDYIHCNTDQKEPCSLSFDILNSFDVYFWPYDNDEYWFYMIEIDSILNNSFTLVNAIGNCGTSLKNNKPENTDPSLYKSCFCCGDKYNPHPSLGCPVSPWS